MSDLTILFDTDPLSLSREDRRAIVEDLRRLRHGFNVAAKPAKAPTKTPTRSVMSSADLELDLDI